MTNRDRVPNPYDTSKQVSMLFSHQSRAPPRVRSKIKKILGQGEGATICRHVLSHSRHSQDC